MTSSSTSKETKDSKPRSRAGGQAGKAASAAPRYDLMTYLAIRKRSLAEKGVARTQALAQLGDQALNLRKTPKEWDDFLRST